MAICELDGARVRSMASMLMSFVDAIDESANEPPAEKGNVSLAVDVT